MLIVPGKAEDFKEKLEDLSLPCLAEVIGFDELKSDFTRFKDKRQLFKDYDLFFSDIRVYKMLPKCMGWKFYEGKKYPYPVKFPKDIAGQELQDHINGLIDHTYFQMGNGPNYALKIGRSSMKSKRIVDNILQALPQILAQITFREDIRHTKVQQISVWMANSPELPIYSHLENEEIAAYALANE